ncbi:hypothetical protein AOLI_G00229420 [Acnodon oligacanthus]
MMDSVVLTTPLRVLRSQAVQLPNQTVMQPVRMLSTVHLLKLPLRAEPSRVMWAVRPPGAHQGTLLPGLSPVVGPSDPLLGRVHDCVRFSWWVFLDRVSLGLHSRPVCPGRPYREHIAPDELALKIPRPHKPFHHNKALIQERPFKHLKTSMSNLYQMYILGANEVVSELD